MQPAVQDSLGNSSTDCLCCSEVHVVSSSDFDAVSPMDELFKNNEIKNSTELHTL